eukprot:CAMPEP_0170483748 /NCGR_PEP_ID=MMETSP0208-20121228/3370_1 /TAXON_ID=197538 /ORGANISM="Strombidium inclinatum, Strain S3" /LENGTH=149 /DNA_ID=CAMNT_0010756893 /DNA_START=844 /DNA_END=1293 /DNA_ORIENTATION=-
MEEKRAKNRIVDDLQFEELCLELSGNSKLCEEPVKDVIYSMVDCMVDNLIEGSCKYANLRNSECVEKQDIHMAIAKMFPDTNSSSKSNDVELSTAIKSIMIGAEMGMEASQHPSIGVAGQVSTANYRTQLLRVRHEQEQQMMIEKIKKT